MALGAGGVEFNSRAGQIRPTAHYRCNVSSELCCAGVNLWRWSPPLVTRIGVTQRKFDFVQQFFETEMHTSIVLRT